MPAGSLLNRQPVLSVWLQTVENALLPPRPFSNHVGQMQTFSQRTLRHFFAYFAVLKALDRKDRKGVAKFAKKP
jgi:hypothetical protein